jgi:hypothetical protein
MRSFAVSNNKYFGNGAYCWANSAAMLLASIGEDISPSTIEVLGGVGIGAMQMPGTNISFFSGFSGLPDKGISKALDILGFEYVEKSQNDPENFPLDELKRVLKESPAVLGPLDMGYLAYDPKASGHKRVDHFVFAYNTDHESVHLHDPAGFPCVRIDFDGLRFAWMAEKIGYKRGHYRYWTKVKRVRNPSEDEIYRKAINHFKWVYLNGEKYAKKKGRVVDVEAIKLLAEKAKAKRLQTSDIDMLSGFAFPLGARRALDFASFFTKKDPELANLKTEQAKLFGRCQVLVVKRSWNELKSVLEELAEVEKKFKAALLSNK